MIEDVLNFYANVSKKFYPFIIILALILAVVSFQQASKTEISTDLLGFFYQDTEGMSETRMLRSDFMGTDTVKILIEADRIVTKDVLEDDVLDMTLELVDTVSIIPGVFRVSSVLDLGNSRDDILHNSFAETSDYLSTELQYSIIIIELDSAEVPDRAELIDTFKKTVNRVDLAKGTKVTVAGSPALYNAWDHAVRTGFAKSIIVSAVTISVVLFFVFRSPITSSFVMIPILVAVLTAFGTMHFINIPLNFLTVMFGAVTLGLGVDYSIHLVQRYHEELRKGNNNALNVALSRIGRNTIFTGLTTMAAFSSMTVSGLRMLMEYGVMSFIAISFSVLSVLLFLPSFLILESKIGSRKFELSKIFKVLGLAGFLSTLMIKLSTFSLKRPIAVIFFVSVGCVPVFYGLFQIETLTDVDAWLPQENPSVKANNIIDDEFGDYDYTMILVLADDIRDPIVMRAIEKIGEGVQKVPHITEVSSISSLIHPLPIKERSIHGKIEALPLDTRRKYVTEDYTESLIIIKTDKEVDDIMVREIKEVLDYVDKPAEVVFSQAGANLLMSRIDSIIAQDQIRTTMVSLALVMTMLFFAMRGVSGIILGLSPILLAILFAMGSMGLLQIPSTPLTVMLATLLLGLGIDYSIHFIARYREERMNGKTLEEALLITSSTVGESIALTSITTTFGFLSLMTIMLVPVQDFGKIAAVGLVFCAIFVPIIISVGLLFYEKIVRKRMIPLLYPGKA